MKKVKHSKPAWRPARLVEGATRWYILAYDGQRHRLTYDLNRIPDVAQRRNRGHTLVDALNWWMQAGLSIDRFTEAEALRRKAEASAKGIAPRGHTPIKEAIVAAVRVKTTGAARDTVRTYNSISRLFLGYLQAMGWDMLPADEVRRHHIMGYVDYCLVDRKVNANTINNNITILKGLWNWMLERGYCCVNPTEKIKKLPKEAKRRRCFTAEEASVVMRYIGRTDKVLYLALLLEYTCYVRPKEIRCLRIADIDCTTGVVTIRKHTGKTGKKTGDRTATAPKSVTALLQELIPADAALDHYVFGSEGKPGYKQVGHSFFYKRHTAVLKKLLKEGSIDNIIGLTWYSWKDTGITEALDTMPLVAVQEQAGHTSPDMTMVYRQKRRVNEAMRAWEPQALAEPGQG